MMMQALSWLSELPKKVAVVDAKSELASVVTCDADFSAFCSEAIRPIRP